MISAQVRDALVNAGAKVTEMFDGARIQLPPRRRQPVVGALLMAVGAVLATFMVVWISIPLGHTLGGGGTVRWPILFFALAGLPGLLMGLALFVAGRSAWAGTSQAAIEVGGGQLRLTEYFPPFRHSWVKPLAKIHRIRLEGIATEAGGNGLRAGLSPAALVADCDGATTLRIASFYEPAVLRPVAEALQELTGRVVGGGVLARITHDGFGTATSVEPEPMRPARTNVTILEQGDAMAIHAPPAGLVRGSHGLFLFAIFWLVFSAVFLMVWMRAKGVPLPAVLMAWIFPVIGFVMLVVSVHLGRQRLIIAINPHTVAVKRIGPFGVREQRLPRADLMSVECGPSGLKVNDRPVMELQFHFRNRPKIGCLSQLSDEELYWLEAKLRRWLRLSGGNTPPAGGQLAHTA